MKDILVVGDIILDKYWDGTCKRISPEAPVQILDFRTERLVAGGAGNVALNISKWGSTCSIIGSCGYDSDGEELKTIFAENNVKNEIIYSRSFKTISKYRVMDAGRHIIRIDFDQPNQSVCENKIVKKVLSKIKNHKVIILSDYGKGVLNKKSIKAIIKEAKRLNKPVLIDPKGGDFSRYLGAYLLTPNRPEFETIVGECFNFEEIISKGKALRKDLKLENLVITLGSDGMVLIKNKEVKIISSEAKRVFDVSGAGDTSISIAACEIANGSNIDEAIIICNKAAGVVVGKPGTSTVTKSEILVKNKNSGGLLNLSELKQLRNSMKVENKKLVMTNGCFDILHVGHIDYLSRAKKLGDKLVIALNTDSSVTKLKGASRPINNFKDRAELLLALESVDYIVGFSAATPKKIYEEVIPDILVKGGDYRDTSKIVGYDVVTSNGGLVKILNFVEGKSTSSLIDRIRTNQT